jgi:hypothetical protein
MAEQQLSIRSTRARQLAHELAKKEQRTVSQIVERALDIYASSVARAPRESGAEFWQRVHQEHSTEVDLQGLIDKNRLPNKGIDL